MDLDGKHFPELKNHKGQTAGDGAMHYQTPVLPSVYRSGAGSGKSASEVITLKQNHNNVRLTASQNFGLVSKKSSEIKSR